MKIVLPCFALLLACSSLIAADGTVPRSQALSYPSHTEIDGIGVGVLLLKEADVKQRFATDLNREFLVVEVALYPAGGAPINVTTDSFTLHVSGQELALRPENPKVIASLLQKTAPGKRDVRIIPQAEIGYESGTRYPYPGGFDPRYDPTSPGYDPRYDPSAPGYNPRYGRGRGIYTSAGVGVVLGDERPASTDRDQDVMATELSEKSLPNGVTSKAVAGHLYFRVGKKTKQDPKTRYRLEFELQGKTAALPLTF